MQQQYLEGRGMLRHGDGKLSNGSPLRHLLNVLGAPKCTSRNVNSADAEQAYERVSQVCKPRQERWWMFAGHPKPLGSSAAFLTALWTEQSGRDERGPHINSQVRGHLRFALRIGESGGRTHKEVSSASEAWTVTHADGGMAHFSDDVCLEPLEILCGECV